MIEKDLLSIVYAIFTILTDMEIQFVGEVVKLNDEQKAQIAFVLHQGILAINRDILMGFDGKLN